MTGALLGVLHVLCVAELMQWSCHLPCASYSYCFWCCCWRFSHTRAAVSVMMFLTSAAAAARHTLSTLPSPPDEKRSIARRYLEPQALADSGVPGDAVALTDPAMDNLIDEYCR
jgi:hypothetical protein